MNTQAIAIAVAILTALSRVLPATKPLWDRLGKAKVFPPIAIVLVGYALQGLTTGDWLTGLELMVGSIVALLAPGVEEAGGKAAVLALLFVGAFGASGCVGTFEESRMTARLATVSGETRCQDLSDRQAAFGAISLASATLAAPTGLAAIPVTDDGARSALIAGSVILAANAAATGLVADSAGKSWASEGCAK